MKKMPILLVILLMLFVAGCGKDGRGTVAGTNYYYPEQETESEVQTEVEVAVKAELSAEHYMIMANDMTLQHLVLQQMESGEQYLYHYSLTTRFLDKYGNNTAVSYFEPGRMITVGEKDSEGKLKSAQISDDVWEVP
jgi:hypothetical protein